MLAIHEMFSLSIDFRAFCFNIPRFSWDSNVGHSDPLPPVPCSGHGARQALAQGPGAAQRALEGPVVFRGLAWVGTCLKMNKFPVEF